MRLGLVSLRESPSFPPGSLVYLATYLRENVPSISVEIIDINFDDVHQRLASGAFDLVGITAMTVDYAKAMDIAELVKRDLSIPTVIGGVHISLLPSSLRPCFDVAVIGEGEQTMLELVQLFLASGRLVPGELSRIPGLAFFSDTDLVVTTPRPRIEPLDEIPVPDWDLVNPAYFKYRPMVRWGEFGRSGLLLTSRGCPYDCVFCSSKRMWGGIRFHSAEWVVQAVRRLVVNHHVTHITAWDDLFCVNKTRLRSIAAALRQEGLTDSVRFACQGRSNLMDEEMCEILRSMNVSSICFGIESGSERVLRTLKTGNVSVHDNARAIQLCSKYGIAPQVSVIFGSPGEKLEDMKQTLRFLDFAVEHGATDIQTFIMTPLPETEVWRVAKERGLVSDEMDWGSLSLFSDEPMLLDQDVDPSDFGALVAQSRARARSVVWRTKVLPLLTRRPIQAAWFAVNNPSLVLATIFG
jgi:radical SAM superfamily enzyme YgiQ (UPF0313 family)